MDLEEVGWGDVDWIGLAQDRDRWRALVNAVMNLRGIGGKARGKEATRKTKTQVVGSCRGGLDWSGSG
jgi:hypothetical protein